MSLRAIKSITTTSPIPPETDSSLWPYIVGWSLALILLVLICIKFWKCRGEHKQELRESRERQQEKIAQAIGNFDVFCQVVQQILMAR